MGGLSIRRFRPILHCLLHEKELTNQITVASIL